MRILILIFRRGKRRALEFMKIRLEIYRGFEKDGAYEDNIVDIKTYYVSQLNYLLSDIALYLGLKQINTFDIIDALMPELNSGIFTSESISLLKNGVETLYKIRCRLHLHYGEQQELALTLTPSKASPKLEVLTNLEKVELNKIRFLIFLPLYLLLKDLFKDELSYEDRQRLFAAKFTGIDLVDLAVKQISLYKNNYFKDLALKTFVAFLIKRKSSTEDYLHYYKELHGKLGNEPLRKVYIDTLKAFKIEEETLNILALHPLEDEQLTHKQADSLENSAQLEKNCEPLKKGGNGETQSNFSKLKQSFDEIKKALTPQTKRIVKISESSRPASQTVKRSSQQLLGNIQKVPASSPVEPIPLDLNSWLVKLQEKSPEILYHIRTFAKLNEDPSFILDYTNALMTREVKKDIRRFSEQNNLNEADCLNSFYQYLRDLSRSPDSLSKDDDEDDSLKSSPSQQLLFVADTYDYQASAGPVSQEPEHAPSEIAEKTELDNTLAHILRLVESGQPAIDLTRGRNVLSVVGITGSGKSTTVNLLWGCKMIVDPSGGRLAQRISAVDPVAAIGHEKKSETKFPQALELEDTDLVLCDMPGFLDTEGPEVAIAHAVNIRNIFTNAQTNRILVLFNFNNLLTDRADGFKKIIELLIKVFHTKEGLILNTPHILMGVTFVPAHIDFQLVKEEIQELALSAGWDLGSCLEHIIRIDPLNSSLREETIHKLKALRPSEEKGFYNIALTDQELFLLINLAKKISEKISAYWVQGNIKGIIEEYRKINSLQCIPHASITDVIDDLQKKINHKVEKLIEEIRSFAAIDEPRMRVATKERMAKLLSCRPLDICFSPEQEPVSKQIFQMEKELKEAEFLLQEDVNKQIENALSLMIQKADLALKEMIKNRKGQLSAFDITQPDLSDLLICLATQFKLEVIKSLKILLDQVDLETKLRPKKYYFGDLLPLEDLKQKKEKEIHQLILKRQKESKILELQDRFNSALQKLYHSKKNLLKNYASLSKKPLDIHEFFLLANFECIKAEVNTIVDVLAKLRGKAGLRDSYEESVEAFLKVIYQEAYELNKQMEIKALSHSIHIGLEKLKGEASESDLAKLNQCYEKLAGWDEKAFQEAIEKAKRILILEPERELPLILNAINDLYCQKLDIVCRTMGYCSHLSACFPGKEIEAVLKRKDDAIKEEEAKRRSAEVDRFNHSLQLTFREIKEAIDLYMRLNFDKITKLPLNHHDVNSCLSTLGKIIPELAAFSQLWVELDKTLKDESQHYFFPPDEKLLMIQMAQKSKLADYFKCMILFSKASILQMEINLWFEKAAVAAKGIIKKNPQSIIQNGFTIAAGFPEEIITKISFLWRQLQELITQTKNQEIIEIAKKTAKKIDDFKLNLTSEARDQAVESLVEEIKQACAERDFLRILDKLSFMLETLKHESPKNYAIAIKELSSHIKPWLTSNEYETYLAGKNYISFCKVFIAIRKLKLSLKNHIEIDNRYIETTFIHHLNELFQNALKEIQCTTSSQEYFNIKQLKNFIEVLKTLRANDLHPPEEFEISLKEEAIKKWQELLGHQARISILTYEQLSPAINELAKDMIKQYAVAKELSIQMQFEWWMRDQILNLFPKELVYKFGLSVSEFSGDVIFNEAAQTIIDTFHEFRIIDIKLHNPKANGVSFKDALESLTTFPATASHSPHLTKAYDTFLELYSILISEILGGLFDPKENIQKIGDLSVKLILHAAHLHTQIPQTAQLLAYIFAHWTYLNAVPSYFSDDIEDNKTMLLQPHNTQILTILKLLSIDDPKGMENQLAQIMTGEGKSISLGIMSTFFALLGYKVNVICYSSYLSGRDFKAFSELFNKLGVSASISYSTIGQMVNKLMGDHLPNFRTVVNKFLKGETVSVFRPYLNQRNVLLIDEVDVFFGKNFYGRTYVPLTTLPAADLLNHIWDNKEDKAFHLLPMQEKLDQLIKIPAAQKIIENYPNLRPLLRNEIRQMLHTLKLFPGQEILIENCIIQEDQIGYLDEAGNIFFSSHSYSTTFAYLYWYKQGKIRSDKYLKDHLAIPISCGNILYSEIPKFFQLKIGLTATLEGLSKEENEILEKDYQFTKRSFIPSTFKKEPLVEEETLICVSKENQFSEITQDIESKLDKNRACFVFFMCPKDLEEYESYLYKLPSNRSQFKSPEVLTEKISDEAKAAIISRSTSQCKITLLTHVFGRGIDFICRDKTVRDNGGVHIISAFYPETLTEAIQMKGRTCRQDNPGSFRMILCATDLVTQGFIKLKRNEMYETVPDLDEYYRGDFFERKRFLESKREILSSKQFEQINQTMQANKQKHENTLTLAKKIEEGNIEEAEELLKSLNL